MKHFVRVTLAAILVVFVSGGMTVTGTTAAGEKSKLRWFSFEQGLTEAKKANKKVLVDVYTDWCGWCKKMDSETYSDAGIADYLQKNYVLVKLNAESRRTQAYNGKQYSEQELAGGFGVTGYPTTLFLKPTGEAITVLPGYADASQFKTVLSYIAEDHYLTTKFQDYAAGKK